MIAEAAGTFALVSLSTFGSLRLSALFDGIVDQAFFDLRHNVDTHGAGDFAPSPARTVRSVIGALPITHEEHVFIDLGCGKGRALLVAGEFPFKRCIGVEHSPKLHEAALVNLRSYRNGTRRSRFMETRCQDATLFEFPEEPCVIYMFNPFPGPVLECIAKNLERSFRRAPRPITVVYVHPQRARTLARLPFLRSLALSRVLTDYFEVFSSIRRKGAGPCAVAHGTAAERYSSSRLATFMATPMEPSIFSLPRV